jgi:hypothetical protein
MDDVGMHQATEAPGKKSSLAANKIPQQWRLPKIYRRICGRGALPGSRQHRTNHLQYFTKSKSSDDVKAKLILHQLRSL